MNPTLDRDEQFGRVFENDSSSHATHFKHEIKLKRDAQPVQHQGRRIQLAVQQPLKDEIERLLEADIIEKIDGSELVSPIVVSRNAYGKVRLCVDLRDLNKNITIERHPMPNVNTRCLP